MSIRAAILGYGRNGSTMHAGPIEASSEFEMAAVCDVESDRREQAAARFHCPVYSDYREMLRREQLDLVCVLTRNDQHAAMSCDCLRAGVDVLVTKPWAVSVAQAEEMIACAHTTGRKLLPWLPARWGCELRRLRELVRADTIGEVFLIRRVVSSFGTRTDWQTQRRYAGGYLLNWGAHIVDPPMLLAGSRARSVYGRMRQTINPGDVEDLFLAIITLEDGTVVQAEYTVSVIPQPSWVVQGDRGTIVVDKGVAKIHTSVPGNPADPTRVAAMEGQESEAREEVLTGAPYGDEYEIYAEIAAALRGEREAPVSLEDALHVSQVLEAVRLSNDEDRVVFVP